MTQFTIAAVRHPVNQMVDGSCKDLIHEQINLKKLQIRKLQRENLYTVAYQGSPDKLLS